MFVLVNTFSSFFMTNCRAILIEPSWRKNRKKTDTSHSDLIVHLPSSALRPGITNAFVVAHKRCSSNRHETNTIVSFGCNGKDQMHATQLWLGWFECLSDKLPLSWLVLQLADWPEVTLAFTPFRSL